MKKAPDFELVRTGITVADTISALTTERGLSGASYDRMIIQVIPTGGANPSVEVLSWSPDASKYLRTNPQTTRTGLGADIPYEFVIECSGRQIFIAVTAIAAGSVSIAAAGYVDGAI